MPTIAPVDILSLDDFFGFVALGLLVALCVAVDEVEVVARVLELELDETAAFVILKYADVKPSSFTPTSSRLPSPSQKKYTGEVARVNS